MYNEKILSQLQELNFLHVTKKSNVSAMAKKNTFGDTVKFYAQIDKNEVVRKISYKASGCTYFVVFCNHFCELVQGRTIDEALKVNVEQLNQFVELDDNRVHVADIIIHTFALLAKKYRKGVQSGKIVPVDEEEQNKVEEEPVKEKKVTIKEHKEDKLTKSKDKTTKAKQSTKSIKSEVFEEKETVVNENSIKQANNIVALESMVKSSKKSTKNVEPKEKETSTHDVKKLSKMINKISSNQEKTQEDENSKKLHSISENLANLKSKKSKDTKIGTEDQEKDVEKTSKSKEIQQAEPKTEVKKKKSIFDWFKRK